MSNQIYKRVFITLFALAVTLFGIVTVSLILNISFSEKELWIGGGIVFLSTVIFFITPLVYRIITFILGVIAMAIFSLVVIDFSMMWSFVIALSLMSIIS
ncbi:hypothetical protein KKA95_03670, partial [Patescibacteria group bacterium]|nr:hypothetical protein [Patescibacteria group bacterium]